MQGSEKSAALEGETSGRRVHDLLSAAAAPLSDLRVRGLRQVIATYNTAERTATGIARFLS